MYTSRSFLYAVIFTGSCSTKWGTLALQTIYRKDTLSLIEEACDISRPLPTLVGSCVVSFFFFLFSFFFFWTCWIHSTILQHRANRANRDKSRKMIRRLKQWTTVYRFDNLIDCLRIESHEESANDRNNSGKVIISGSDRNRILFEDRVNLREKQSVERARETVLQAYFSTFSFVFSRSISKQHSATRSLARIEFEESTPLLAWPNYQLKRLIRVACRESRSKRNSRARWSALTQFADPSGENNLTRWIWLTSNNARSYKQRLRRS